MNLNKDTQKNSDDLGKIVEEEKGTTPDAEQMRYVSLEERRAPHGSGPCPCCGPYSE